MPKVRILKVVSIILLSILCQGNSFIINPTKNAVWHNEKGLNYLELNDYASAIQEFQLAIILNPNSEISAVFNNNLGLTLYELGDYGSAEKYFKKSIELSPNFLEYYDNFINTYRQRQLLDKLIAEYEKKIQQNQNDFYAFLMLGLIHKNHRDKELAEQYLYKCIKMAPYLELTGQLKKMVKELK